MAAHIISVRPHTDLWIINEVVGVGHEIIKIVLSCSVLCLRDGYALMRKIGAAPDDELCKDPTPGQDIVRHGWVTVVVTCTISAERLKQRIARNRPQKQCARRFIENRETSIVPLHVLFCADAAVRIWRIARRVKCTQSHADTIPVYACWTRR